MTAIRVVVSALGANPELSAKQRNGKGKEKLGVEMIRKAKALRSIGLQGKCNGMAKRRVDLIRVAKATHGCE